MSPIEPSVKAGHNTGILFWGGAEVVHKGKMILIEDCYKDSSGTDSKGSEGKGMEAKEVDNDVVHSHEFETLIFY